MDCSIKDKEYHIYFIRNLISHCCEQLLTFYLQHNGYEIKELRRPKIILSKENFDEKEFEQLLSKIGMSIVKEKELQIVENIKLAVVELVHLSNNVSSIIRKSDYLAEKLEMPYQQISRLFSKHEGITLEKYILMQKMERVKELILLNEYTLSEIAYMMDFSSVHHLSAAFKKYCGKTVSEFKQNLLNKFREEGKV